MTDKVEITLSHDGRNWITVGDPDICASSVSELEHRLLAHLDMIGSGAADISLRCNRNLLPTWMRQYGAHYFNRFIRYRPRTTTDG